MKCKNSNWKHLKLCRKSHIFDETQDNLDVYSYAGKVLSAIIEHDGNHKLCVEVSKDDAHVFDLNRMHNIKLFQVNARPAESLT